MEGDVINLLVVMMANTLASMIVLAVETGASAEYMELLSGLVNQYIELLGPIFTESLVEYPELREMLVTFTDHITEITAGG